jgi:hemerythrin
MKNYQSLLKKINDLFLSFSDKNMNRTIKDVSSLLIEWIEDHLMRMDKKYVGYLLSKK